jgi:uncharacterized phage protein (TIGR01671 family)
MREILFRGKTYSNKWVYGYLIKGSIDNDFYILENVGGTPFCINPETIGQFTGLLDKNGKKIFEGDIVVTRYTNGEICSIGDIQFDCGVFGAEWTVHKEHKTMVGGWGQLHNLRRLDDDIINHIEVIGNIHDNKELLGE